MQGNTVRSPSKEEMSPDVAEGTCNTQAYWEPRQKDPIWLNDVLYCFVSYFLEHLKRISNRKTRICIFIFINIHEILYVTITMSMRRQSLPYKARKHKLWMMFRRPHPTVPSHHDPLRGILALPIWRSSIFNKPPWDCGASSCTTCQTELQSGNAPERIMKGSYIGDTVKAFKQYKIPNTNVNQNVCSAVCQCLTTLALINLNTLSLSLSLSLSLYIYSYIYITLQ